MRRHVRHHRILPARVLHSDLMRKIIFSSAGLFLLSQREKISERFQADFALLSRNEKWHMSLPKKIAPELPIPNVLWHSSNRKLIHLIVFKCHWFLSCILAFYFSADDSFQDFLNTNVILRSDGGILWMFPAVMKTYCSLDVKHFPFDSQHCKIIFISWTFNGYKLNLNFNASEHQTVYYTPKNQVFFTRSACVQNVLYLCVLFLTSVFFFFAFLNRLFRADDSFQDFMNTYSIVTSDGSVLWMFPAVMKTYCTLDVRHFPFDRQHCKIIFISWTFNGFKLNVTFNASEHQTVYYTPRNQVLTSFNPLLV